MSRKSLNRLVILIVCVLVLLVVDLFITTRLFLNSKESPVIPCMSEPLPCRALPTRFVIEEPICANKLLRFMNVSNVRILDSEFFGALWNKSILYSKNLSEKYAWTS